MDYLRTTWYMIPAPFISYLIGKKARQIWVLILLHILLISIYVFIIHDAMLSTIYGAYILVLAFMTFSQKIKGNSTPNNTKLVLLAVIAICYLYCEYMKWADLKKVFFCAALLFILLYFINHYLLNFRNYFLLHGHMGDLPIHPIEANNHTLVFAFGIISFITILALTLLPINDILSFLGKIIATILLKVIFFFYHFNQDTGNTGSDYEISIPPPIPKTENPLLENLSTIILHLLAILLIIIIIGGLIYILKNVYKMFYEKRTNAIKDKLEFVHPFKNSNIKRRERKSLPQIYRSLFNQSNSEKIRKHYYHAIVKNCDPDQITKHMTPTQLTSYAFSKDNLSENSVNNARKEELTALYEKARYSKEECSKIELGKVKKLLK